MVSRYGIETHADDTVIEYNEVQDFKVTNNNNQVFVLGGILVNQCSNFHISNNLIRGIELDGFVPDSSVHGVSLYTTHDGHVEDNLISGIFK